MTTMEQVREWIGHDAIDTDGDKIGEVDGLYVDDETGEPEWFAVRTGWFGGHVSLVPVEGARAEYDRLRVPYEKSHVKDAPHHDPDGRLSPEEEAELYAYYGRSMSSTRTAPTTGAAPNARGDTGRAGRSRDTSGRDGEGAMTRSEEEIEVGTTRRPAGRARLRKWVETEHVQRTVPIRKEHAELVTEPITDDNIDEAMSGPDISGGEHEVVLTEEEPVIEKRTVPKERVRLEKDADVEQETISADVRKERIETEGDVDERRRR
jgi:stress response protein YsnF/sporulation protein YlmC with PRC-barrel domain